MAQDITTTASNTKKNSIATVTIWLIIGGIALYSLSKLFMVDRGPLELVEELKRKQFGNKWVSAFELSKYLAAGNRLSDSERSIIVRELTLLSEDYLAGKTADIQTFGFVLTALGSIAQEDSLSVFERALMIPDGSIQFKAVVGLSQFSKGTIPWYSSFDTIMSSTDGPLKQAMILMLATHAPKSPEDFQINSENTFLQGLSESDLNVKYSSAIALISSRNEAALPVLRDIALLNEGKWNPQQLELLKLQMIARLTEFPWDRAVPIVESIVEHEKLEKVRVSAINLLNVLKK